MELKEFISKSIQDICYGIRDAQKEVSTKVNNYPIAPAFWEGRPISNEIKQSSIDFDIAVSTSEVNSENKKGAITIKIADGELSKSNEKDTEIINRLKFSVPFYPQGLNAKDKK